MPPFSAICVFIILQSAVTISGYVDVAVNNEPQLQAAVAQQPVSVAVSAGGSNWQFYSGTDYHMFSSDTMCADPSMLRFAYQVASCQLLGAAPASIMVSS
jgi:hypothetical protein